MSSIASFLRRMPLRALASAMLMSLASCMVGPNYQCPPQQMPTTYKSAATQPTTAPALSVNWWRLFDDPELTRLEESALHANPDIQAAMARVEQARAAAKIVGAQFYPVITFDPSFQRGRQVVNSSNTTFS